MNETQHASSASIENRPAASGAAESGPAAPEAAATTAQGPAPARGASVALQLPPITAKHVIIAAAVAVASILFVVRFDDVVGFLALALHVIRPFIWGVAAAYLVNLVMKLWERVYFPRSTNIVITKTRRVVCIVLAIGTIAGILTGVIWLLASEVSQSVGALAAGFTQTATMLYDLFAQDPTISAWLEAESANIETAAEEALAGFGGVGGIVGSMVKVGGNAVSVLASALLGLIFALYLLMGKERIIAATKSVLEITLPKPACRKLLHAGSVANDCFSRFITGQCLEAIILGSLCAIGMKILGLPYAGTVGLCVGLTSLIPFIGAWIGGIVGALIIASVSFMQALYFLIFLIVLQQIEGHLIYPNVVGAAVEMPGIWTFVAVVAGGSLFGLVGVLVGVPIVSTVRKLVLEWKAARDARLAAEGALDAEATDAPAKADA